MKEKEAEEKTAARGEILEETEGRQAKMERGVGKPEQGDAGNNSGADQKQSPTRNINPEMAAALPGKIE